MTRISQIIRLLVLLVLLPAAVKAADVNVPGSLAGVTPTGTGTTADPYTYTFSGALDMGDTNLLAVTSYNANLENTVLNGITALNYGAGGLFNFSGGDSRAFLKIYSSGDLSTRSIKTSSGGGTHKGGVVTLVSSNGAVNVDGSILTYGNSGGGAVNITAQSVVVATNIATYANNNDFSSYIGNVTINATNDIEVGGAISTYVNGTWKAAGDVTITSELGSISIGGSINTKGNTSNPGDLALTATNGGIVLAELNVGTVTNITLLASKSFDTIVTGDVLGFDGDIGDGDIDVIVAATSHVLYDPEVPANAYLSAGTYPIINSVGGSFFLKPPDPSGTVIVIR